MDYFIPMDRDNIEPAPNPKPLMVERVTTEMYDKDGHIVGLDIEYASKHLDLKSIQVEGFMPKVDVQPGA